MPFDPKIAWRAAKEIASGENGHHVRPKRMAMKLPNGEKATNDK